MENGPSLFQFCGAEIEDTEPIIMPGQASFMQVPPEADLTIGNPPSGEDSLASTPTAGLGSAKREDIHSFQQPQTLQQELNLTNFNKPNVQLVEVSACYNGWVHSNGRPLEMQDSASHGSKSWFSRANMVY